MTMIMINCNTGCLGSEIVDKIVAVLSSCGVEVDVNNPSDGLFLLQHTTAKKDKTEQPAHSEPALPHEVEALAEPDEQLACADIDNPANLIGVVGDDTGRKEVCSDAQTALSARILSLSSEHVVPVEQCSHVKISKLITSNVEIVNEPAGNFVIFNFGGQSYKYPVWYPASVDDDNSAVNLDREITPTDIKISLHLLPINNIHKCILSVCSTSDENTQECVQIGQDLHHI